MKYIPVCLCLPAQLVRVRCVLTGELLVLEGGVQLPAENYWAEDHLNQKQSPLALIPVPLLEPWIKYHRIHSAPSFWEGK
jgi:hypothetical protein